MTQDIYLLIEHIQGQVSDLSFIITAAAKELAAKVGGSGVVILPWQNFPRMLIKEP